MQPRNRNRKATISMPENPERRNNPLHDDTRVAGNTLEEEKVVSWWGLLGWDGDIKLTGQSSAASFPTGPVIADPFISPLGLTICDIMVSTHPSIRVVHPAHNFRPLMHAILAPILQSPSL